MNRSIRKLFANSLHWNFYGCLLYEALHIFHITLVFQQQSNELFALFVTLFSLFPLAIKCSDFGFSGSLSFYWQTLKKNRNTFSSGLVRYSIMPLAIFTGGVLLLFITVMRLSDIKIGTIVIICMIILSETWIHFLRRLLNLAWYTKAVVLGEVILYYLKISIWWLVWFYSQSIFIIIIIMLFYRLILAAYFSMLLWIYSKSLPKSRSKTILPHSFIIQLSIGGLRLGRELCSAPALSSYFSYYCGIPAAGVFYFATKIASSINNLAKMTLGYSGGALLASSGDSDKNDMLHKLCMLHMQAIVIIGISIVCNLDAIIALYKTTSLFLVYCAFWLIIQAIDTLTIVYEQYFIVQEASTFLFSIRLIELFFSSIAAYFYSHNITLFIFLLCAIKITIFIATWLYSYLHWQASWHYKPTKKTILIGIFTGLFLRVLQLQYPFF